MPAAVLDSLVLYFAYGSNLDDQNWLVWCERKGYDPASLEPLFLERDLPEERVRVHGHAAFGRR